MTLSRLTLHILAAVLIAPALLPAAEAAGRDSGPGSALNEPPPSATPGPLESATPSGAPPSAVNLWLRGAFGRVAGGSLVDPAGAPPGDEPLDTFVTRAALLLELPADPGVALQRISTRAVAAETAPSGDGPAATGRPSGQAPDPPVPPGSTVLWEPTPGEGPQPGGSVQFDGPAVPGVGLIVAELATAAGRQEMAWLVRVPDRAPPVDGLYDIPAPGILVSSTGGEQRARDGSGCYAYLCVDVGYRPPVEDLPTLPVAVNETLEVRLEDGSAMVGWKARLSRLDGSRPGTLEAEVGPGDPDDEMLLSGVAAPSAGRWLLDLFVEFDRERGWMRTYLVIDAR